MVTSASQQNMPMTGDRFWEIRIPSKMLHGRREVEKFVSRAIAWGVTHEESLALRHSLHEAVVNAVRHGNQGDASRSVRICYRFLSDDIFLEVEDEGRGFDRAAVPDPTTDENRIRPGGRGLLMMRHFMNSVEYNERGNCVTMRRTCQRA